MRAAGDARRPGLPPPASLQIVTEARLRTLHLFTFKAGLLSRVAHDLRLTAGSWSVGRDGDGVRARVALGTLAVDGAMRRGVLDPGALSARDRRTIEEALRDEVLDVGRYPEAAFDGRVEGGALVGTLVLRGRSAPVRLDARRGPDGALHVDGELAPSAWGIAPYKALMGAIHLQDRVRVVAVVPA